MGLGQSNAAGLSPADEVFCLEVLKGGTQADAYARAFPNFKGKRKTLYEKASQKAAEPKIVARMAELRTQVLTAPAIADEQECLRTLTLVMRGDPRKFYDEDGKLKKLKDLDGETVIALQSIEGEGKIKLYSRVEAADKILRFHALARQHPLPVEGGDVFENEPDQYEWARRMVLLLHNGQPGLPST
jgi:hypothetical protein